MNDAEQLIDTLTKTKVPHIVDYDKDYVTVTIEADASDKYVTIIFKGGEFAYSN